MCSAISKKSWWEAGLIWLALVATSVASTIVIPPVQISMTNGTTVFSCENFQPLQIGTVTIPAKHVLIPLLQSESPWSVAGTFGEVTSLHESLDDQTLRDTPTADDYRYDAIPVDNLKYSFMSGNTVSVIGEVQIGSQRYAEVLVFGLVRLEDETVASPQSVTIKVGEREVSAAEVTPYEQLSAQIHAQVPRDFSKSASADVSPYLIITSEPLREQSERLAVYKSATRMQTSVKLIDEILNTSSGRDDAEKLRNWLKTYYAAGGRYLLLAGDETLLPIRLVSHIARNSQPATEDLLLCDLYFADLTGEWDVDNDGIWGEPFHDNPDYTPELMVGRLPFRSSEQMRHYVDKLISYESNPGNGDKTYLTRNLFFSSDQMRDYALIGQHGLIARSFPSQFIIDSNVAVESPRGDDPNPTNAAASELGASFDQGYGIIQVIAHGRADGFSIRTAGTNNWPKSFLLSTPVTAPHAMFDTIMTNGKPSFYYSLACDNAGFDMDQPPFGSVSPTMTEYLLGAENGAVGFVGYTRWGWVSTSYLLQKSFFDTLFAHPELPAIYSMYASQALYPQYRDLVYSQLYLGDPTMKIYTSIPSVTAIHVTQQNGHVSAEVSIDGSFVGSGTPVSLFHGTTKLEETTTGIDGVARFTTLVNPIEEYYCIATVEGATVGYGTWSPQIVTDVHDDLDLLPSKIELFQNYPNPFNPTTTIGFTIPTRQFVVVEIFNSIGQEVRMLENKVLAAGSYELSWDATDQSGQRVSSGVYFCRLSAETFEETKRMVLLK